MKRALACLFAVGFALLSATPVRAVSTTITVPFKENQITWCTTARTRNAVV